MPHGQNRILQNSPLLGKDANSNGPFTGSLEKGDRKFRARMEEHPRACRTSNAFPVSKEEGWGKKHALLGSTELSWKKKGMLPGVGIPFWRPLLVYQRNNMRWSGSRKLAGKDGRMSHVHCLSVHFFRSLLGMLRKLNSCLASSPVRKLWRSFRKKA